MDFCKARQLRGGNFIFPNRLNMPTHANLNAICKQIRPMPRLLMELDEDLEMRIRLAQHAPRLLELELFVDADTIQVRLDHEQTNRAQLLPARSEPIELLFGDAAERRAWLDPCVCVWELQFDAPHIVHFVHVTSMTNLREAMNTWQYSYLPHWGVGGGKKEQFPWITRSLPSTIDSFSRGQPSKYLIRHDEQSSFLPVLS